MEGGEHNQDVVSEGKNIFSEKEKSYRIHKTLPQGCNCLAEETLLMSGLSAAAGMQCS